MTPGDDQQAAEARIDAWVEQAQRQAQAAERMAALAQELSTTERSRDHSVHVTVDSSGVVTGLELLPTALDRPPAELSAAILDTMRRAQARMADQVAAIAAETMGEDSAAARQVRTTYRDRFGTEEQR